MENKRGNSRGKFTLELDKDGNPIDIEKRERVNLGNRNEPKKRTLFQRIFGIGKHRKESKDKSERKKFRDTRAFDTSLGIVVILVLMMILAVGGVVNFKEYIQSPTKNRATVALQKFGGAVKDMQDKTTDINYAKDRIANAKGIYLIPSFSYVVWVYDNDTRDEDFKNTVRLLEDNGVYVPRLDLKSYQETAMENLPKVEGDTLLLFANGGKDKEAELVGKITDKSLLDKTVKVMAEMKKNENTSGVNDLQK